LVIYGQQQGKTDWMEIDKTLFDAFNEFELDDLSFFNEVDRHYERSEMTEAHHSGVLTPLHICNLFVCKLPKIVQHQTATLFFRQLGDCSV